MSRIAAFTFAAADRMGTSTSWSEISRCRTASSAKISPGFRYTRMGHLRPCKAWEGKDMPTGFWVATSLSVPGMDLVSISIILGAVIAGAAGIQHFYDRYSPRGLYSRTLRTSKEGLEALRSEIQGLSASIGATIPGEEA